MEKDKKFIVTDSNGFIKVCSQEEKDIFVEINPGAEVRTVDQVEQLEAELEEQTKTKFEVCRDGSWKRSPVKSGHISND